MQLSCKGEIMPPTRQYMLPSKTPSIRNKMHHPESLFEGSVIAIIGCQDEEEFRGLWGAERI